jgi:hypothetical protein
MVARVRFKPWEWGRDSHERAVANARAATTELSRRRVEREDVELYLTDRAARRAAAAPQPA